MSLQEYWFPVINLVVNQGSLLTEKLQVGKFVVLSVVSEPFVVGRRIQNPDESGFRIRESTMRRPEFTPNMTRLRRVSYDRREFSEPFTPEESSAPCWKP